MKSRELTKQEKELKLVGLIKNVFDAKNGNGVRKLVKIVSNAYDENPEKLRKYFNSDNLLVVGIATSAYHFLTGDIRPIQTREYGGLGAIINDSEEGLKFNRNQLSFAKLSGFALQNSTNSGKALFSSENSGIQEMLYTILQTLEELYFLLKIQKMLHRILKI